MKLHLLLPGLLAVLFLSGCVVEETYAGRGYHDRGPSYGYRDTVYVEGRSSPRYRDNSYYGRGYDRDYHRDYDRSDYRSNNRSYSRSSDDRSRSDYSRSGNSSRSSYSGSRTAQRPVKDPASEYYKQQRSKAVKNQQKSEEKEKRNRD